MNFNRRTFIKTAGGAAVAGMLPIDSIASFLQSPDKTSIKPIVVILDEPEFPSGEIPAQSRDAFLGQLQAFDVRFVTVKELKEILNPANVTIYINPYGSRFPKEAWGVLIKYLNAGGNWINLGGVPFSIPVVRDGLKWREEIPQVAYHKKLGITQSFPVETEGVTVQGLGANEFEAKEVYELYYRFTETRDFPNEDGPAGARDATLTSLAFSISNEKKRIAAPLIQIDRLQGGYTGGRWILANFKGIIQAGILKRLAERAVFGATELTVHTSFACYQHGEVPSITVQLRKPKSDAGEYLLGKCEFEILNERNKRVDHTSIPLKGTGQVVTGYWTMNENSLSPGLYTVKVRQNINLHKKTFTGTIEQMTGFWVYDKKLMESGTPFTTNETYLLKDNKPYPVTGTTYMGSDVHRKFLFEPNPYLWDKDFAEMHGAGINMVRTGIWTAWKNYMLDIGAPNEVALRSVDAFILTARKYNIPIVFTFFAFLPEMWGGENPYLDPRSVNAQKEFITVFSQRYSGVKDIIWDFINEPSFCNPQQLWMCRPNYDQYESAAWNSWLKKRYPADSDDQRNMKFQEMYRTTPDESVSLPSLEEFADANIFNDKNPIKVIDYRLFAQDMFVQWTKEMTKAIKSNGNPHQLITVGQDEGGTYERPSPQFYAEAVDFTCLHNWWYNGDLLWDSVITKAPGKPNLLEETGVMFYEKMDGSAWRTEQEVALLLERKLAMSLCAGGAGFIEWIWNTNPYMKSDNEAAIGIHRVDGTAKPEFVPISRYATFMAEHHHLMAGRVDEDVLMVIPHSQMYSTRNFATEATQRCVRSMIGHCRVAMRAVSEYRLDTITLPPKLIVVPSPGIFTNEAWASLLKFAEQGSTVLISGVIDSDEHWLPVKRSEQIGYSATRKLVTQSEYISIDGREFLLNFRGDKIQRIEKAVTNPSLNSVVFSQHGKGVILWSPLPVELSEGYEALDVLYKFALAKANVQPLFSLEPEMRSILVIPTRFAETDIITFISETDRDTDVFLTHTSSNTQHHIHIAAQRTSQMIVRRSDGSLISQLH